MTSLVLMVEFDIYYGEHHTLLFYPRTESSTIHRDGLSFRLLASFQPTLNLSQNMTFTPGVGPDGTAPPNSSGIHVIIVGLGVAGLTAAIECYRKGHRVTLFERSPVVKGVGKSEAIQVLAKACNSSSLK